MIRFFNLLFYIGCLGVILASCGKRDSMKQPPLVYNPFVEAFTSGTISRCDPVYLIFSQEIPEDRVKADQIGKHMRIQPNVAGKWSVENNKTFVFRPEKEFDRNTSYKITADLSKWFDTQKAEETFTFGFTTYPLALRGDLESMEIHPRNENGYDFSVAFFTPDKEKPETVESLVDFSEKVNATWQHGPDGKKHALVLTNVPADQEGGRELRLFVPQNKEGVKEEELITIKVPGQNDFSIYDITYAIDPERYIEVAFTKTLDSEQNMRGLAFVAGNTSETVNIIGNKLRLYPDASLWEKGVMNVHLNQGIRCKNGLTLEETVVRQIVVDERKPNVRFIGNGVIIPHSEQLSVPFQAIYLRGVTVSIIKVLERNIGQFLQSNNLDGSGELMRVGRLVARKTIFLDEDGLDLSRWNTFSLDLRKLIEPEPGAIYRIELSFDRPLSAYPCGKDTVSLSKEQILAMDEVRFKEEAARFDEEGYYYYRQYDWSDYDWKKRDDPCSNSYYINKVVGRNVLATNLGLMAFWGQDDDMTVLVHNIQNTKPEQGVMVTAYNYQHQPLISGTTDSEGRTQLKLTSGRPFYLIASRGTQRSYLRVDNGSALSLSSFDVSGDLLQKGIKGFIYGERGVWRPGDTLHIGFMLNDRARQLPARHPVVMELYNPLGQLYARKTRVQGQMGLYAFDFATDQDAPTGAWNIKVSVGGASFTKRIRIESIKPNRLKIAFSLPEKTLLRGDPMDARLHVEWLQGATARDLKYDIQGTFIATPTTFEGYSDFQFDDPARVFRTEESKLISGTTDAKGNATIRAHFDLGNAAPGMLLANIVTRVYEESGDFSVDANRMLFSPYRRYVGIKSPQQGKTQLNTGTEYTYRVASVDYQGKSVANAELEVRVYKLQWHWWWDSNNSGLANYVSDSYNKPVKSFSIRTGNDGRGIFKLSFPDEEWGTYFISVKDLESKHATGIMSYFDWPSSEGRRDADRSESATMLSFKTDKEQYVPGEKMVVTFPSTKGSRAIISIENGVRVLALNEYPCEDKQTTVKLDVTQEMRPNAYVHVILLQPHGDVGNDLPIRLYGVVPFTVNSPESHLNPIIQTPKEIKPEAPYTISVSEKDGKEMAYTLAVVDEGLLDLTHFSTPDPWSAFNAREALGVNTWDLYNYVLGAYGGRIERLFSIGGDDALNKGPKAIVNRFKPVVRFEGPFLLEKGKTARHTYQMPNYNGRVRVMVIAGNGEAYGHAEKSVMVRKPVMLLGTLPRVIGAGEEMAVAATVFATEDKVGEVRVSIDCSSNMEVMGEREKQLFFERKTDQQALFRIRAKEDTGVGKIVITAVGKEDRSVYEAELEIRTIRRPLSKVLSVTLEGGKSREETVLMPGMDGTNQLTLEVSNVSPVNLSARVASLLDYPHGCLEQITSKGFPLLYLSSFADLTQREAESKEEIVKEVIRRLRSYQTVDGAFAYWPGGSNADGWGTVYATHFLLEASREGYLVPEAMRQGALNQLSRFARNWRPVASPYRDSEAITQAYRLYVLALAQSPEMGAMNRMKEQKVTGISQWLLASAYAFVGRMDVAQDLLREAAPVASVYTEYDNTFGSDVRDQSIRLMTLCLLNRDSEAASLAEELSQRLSADDWLSTQATSFALVALSNFMDKYRVDDQMDFMYACGENGERVTTRKNIWSARLMEQAGGSTKIRLENKGRSTLFARIITEGTPEQGEEKAYANGISLAVSYVDLKGMPIDISELKQGTNFSAVVTIRNTSSRGYNHLVLSEIFPAGWEILNTRFLNEAATDSLVAGVSYQDIRDDRVYSYIDRLPAGRQVAVRINLCAVYSGRFYLPPVYCEAMYDHLIRANTEGKRITVE